MAQYLPASGFVARGDGGPDREHPRDWIVWHFTHIGNLPAIINRQVLLPDSAVTAPVDVANQAVKARRRHIHVAPDHAYPPSTVSDHVPFYIAAKSPMLYVVTRPPADSGPLVQLGIALGDLIDAGLIWCASDGNAAAGFTRFSRDLPNLGGFVDFDLLCQRDWYNTPDDQDRKSRRAAEVLVLGSVPVSLISYVVTAAEQTMQAANREFTVVGGDREYVVLPELFY